MGGWGGVGGMGGHLVIIELISVQLQLKLDFQLELSLAKLSEIDSQLVQAPYFIGFHLYKSVICNVEAHIFMKQFISILE